MYRNEESKAPGRRTLLVAGGAGLVGSHLVRRLLARSDRLIVWECARHLAGRGVQPIESLECIHRSQRIDAVVNLAGAPLLPRPWTRRRRHELVASRVEATASLRRLIARLDVKPEVLLNASATGYYGTSGDEKVYETGLPGPGFHSDLCLRWESESRRVENYGVRVVRARFGLVLGKDAGWLPAAARLFGLGAGTVLGSGRQWVSWVHVEDAARLCEFVLETPPLRGAVNVTAPRPVRQETFARAVGSHCNAPVRWRIPALPLRLVLGEMAGLLVEGQRVLPQRALECGFDFAYPSLDAALDGLMPDPARGHMRHPDRAMPAKRYRNA